jgi:lipopolysaccharide export system permease protein
MPYANKELRLSRIDFKNNYASLAFNPQTFETLNKLTIYAKNRDENNHLSGILLHDERAEGYSITITAKNGNIVSENNSGLLYMEDGTVQKFNYTTKKSEILNFDNYVFNLTEAKKGSDSMRWKPKERYISELINPGDDTEESELRKYRAEIHERFTYPLLPIIFSLIGISFVLRGQFSRSGNLPNTVIAISVATGFLILTMTIGDLVETSTFFSPLLYLNFLAFGFLSYKILTEKIITK